MSMTPRSLERQQEMLSMYRQGCSLAQIGAKYGVTRERARQVIKKGGGSASSGGAAVRSKARQARVDSERQRKTFARYGCDHDTYLKIKAAGAVGPFRHQRQGAKSRGIAWSLRLSEWWAVWQESGKWGDRGRGIGKFCMSRIADAGPYAVGNIHIQSCQQNSRDAVQKWRDAPPKAFRGVYDFYPGRPLRYAARLGGKRLGFFKTQEEAAMARLSAQTAREVAGCA
jgi:hypothetical protein